MEPVIAEVAAVLSRTPPTLRALLEGLPDAWLEAREDEGTFSPRDVVGHLIHGEKTDWVPRIRLILEAGESRPFLPFDRFAFREAIRGVPTGALLMELASLRAANLAFLHEAASFRRISPAASGGSCLRSRERSNKGSLA
jgi:hypothetical protein